MQGLRTQENDKFLKFFELVQQKANEQGKVFFGDCGDGHEHEDDTIECEDMFGWLIDKKVAKEFEKDFLSESQNIHKWDNDYISVTWKMVNDIISIKFN